VDERRRVRASDEPAVGETFGNESISYPCVTILTRSFLGSGKDTIVDLSSVTFVSSMGIRMLIAVEAIIAALELVLEECVTNTLRYGYESTGLRWVDLAVSLCTDEVRLTIEDDARPFDPCSDPEPELPKTLDEARIGGLGLFLVRRTASTIDHERVEGRNTLTIRLARHATADEADCAARGRT
jgi:serine/threonine-protein kinase RsbW